MKRLVLQIILRLGRYAVLPAVALACTILAGWLMIMDRHTIAALATAPIVFTIFMAAMALAIGLLFLPSRKHRSFEADEETAPGLWAVWKELDRSCAGVASRHCCTRPTRSREPQPNSRLAPLASISKMR
ncbi:MULTISPECIES: hypothetical protein [unclassified Bradyrhizobium]|uniref:hypothetical protein n=1 Tax=unclassified Bradyrhizobium TaxID=2631580 RepID=UPI00211F4112|nr:MULTISPECIES: hypothetical protein [unclassified Bradyrhizobium]